MIEKRFEFEDKCITFNGWFFASAENRNYAETLSKTLNQLLNENINLQKENDNLKIELENANFRAEYELTKKLQYRLMEIEQKEKIKKIFKICDKYIEECNDYNKEEFCEKEKDRLLFAKGVLQFLVIDLVKIVEE